ncbi:MAG: aminopeptidase P family protein [Bacteroidales bacterium]|nr:aminopeptidase P family protein [Bacteroidales bacterium]MCF8328039.1 aminopeptidase P family protein [Bacteroidales bacterium]
MFKKEVYTQRRDILREKMDSGLVLLPGNPESPMNAAANTFHFRQDSSFLYYFGLDFPDIIGIVDIDNNKDYLFADDVDLDDIIWMGPQETLKEVGAKVGVENTFPFCKAADVLSEAISKGRKIHFLPQYRSENVILMEKLLGIHPSRVPEYVSEELIKAVVDQRSAKDHYEIEELDKAANIGYQMHITAMRMAKPEMYEREIAGRIEGIALSHGGMLSFPVILTVNGQTLHNHYHGNLMKEGDLMLTDAGAETPMHYASDFTRTIPVGGKFTPEQKDIYNIVLHANNRAFKHIKPGVTYKEIHLMAAATIMEGLKDLGIVKGDPNDAVQQGAHALFMPHGLGHMMGLDVHDMEAIGEDYVGYDNEVKRSSVFGIGGLRMGRKLQPNFVITNEPGLYFIPELIDRWKSEKKFTEFINYDKVEAYRNFGGIRLEDDILITQDGCRLLGDKRLPITVEDVEAEMKKDPEA